MCGITGLVCSNCSINAMEIYESLLSIQHRGQDGAGICVLNDNTDNTNDNNMIKGKGLISDIFNYNVLKNISGKYFLGHTRYKTNNVSNSFQPFIMKNDSINMAFCHNGNIINVSNLIRILIDEYNNIDENLLDFSDSYILFTLIFEYISNAVNNNNEKLTMRLIEKLTNYLHVCVVGSYSIILYIENFGMFIMKDKYGIRPLIYGVSESGCSKKYLISSESCSLNNVLNYKIIKEVDAGETIGFLFNNNDIEIKKYKGISFLKPCLFEYIYFSRLDSIVNNISIYNFRFLLGKILGKRIKDNNIDVDFIIPTPETSRVYAYGISYETKIPIQECIIKNRYVNRTFIIENKDMITENIKRKFSVINEIVDGKNVLLIDDSVVRGNTSREVIRLLKDGNVADVYFASASPKIYNNNEYGIYIRTKEELITYKNNTDEKIAESIGCKKIIYNTLNDTVGLINYMNNSVNDMEVSMFLNS